MHVAVWVIALMAAGIVVAGFGGALHPVGDSLSILLLPCAVVLTCCALIPRGGRVLRWGAAAVACLGLATVGATRLPMGPPGPVTLYQKNLLYTTNGSAALAQDILGSGAALVTLQEVSARNVGWVHDLRRDFAAMTLCLPDGAAGTGTAILSIWPEVPGTKQCSLGRKLAIMQVQAPQGPVWVASLHLNWPWPYSQHHQLRYAAPILAGLEGPVVLAGDFNMLAWGRSVQTLRAAIAGHPAGQWAPTFWIRGMVPVQIDHVLAPGGGRAELRPRLGSDHHGVLARIHLAPLQ